jgi:putative oxidoreductase
MTSTILLRFALSVILLAHSIPTMLTGTVNDFGQMYLNAIGFAPLGVPLAWGIKLSHVACVAALALEKYLDRRLFAGIIYLTVGILFMGIVLVHYPDGWFVVGGGRNGMEFNFLLIFALLSTLFANDMRKN